MSTVSCAAGRLRSTATTWAPWRAATMEMARPLPMPSPGCCPAPTTTTTLSDRSKGVRSLRWKSMDIVLLARWRRVEVDGALRATFGRVTHRGLTIRRYVGVGGFGVTAVGDDEHRRAYRGADAVS